MRSSEAPSYTNVAEQGGDPSECQILLSILDTALTYGLSVRIWPPYPCSVPQILIFFPDVSSLRFDLRVEQRFQGLPETHVARDTVWASQVLEDPPYRAPVGAFWPP